MGTTVFDLENEGKNNIANANNIGSAEGGLQPPPLQFKKEKKSGNSGEFLGYFPEEVEGERRMVAKFKATPNTWVSESAKLVGLDNVYAKDDAHGAYVLEDQRFYRADGGQMIYPDDLEVGEEFSIVIERQSIQPEEEYKFCPDLDDKKEEPEPPYLIRDTIDNLMPDMLSFSGTIAGGGSAAYGIGGEVLYGEGYSANLITDITSPDFGKLSINPHQQLSGSGVIGAKAAFSPKGGVSFGLSASEYTGDPNDAVLDNISGNSVEVSGAIEGQVLGELEGGIGGGVTEPDKTGNIWGSVGAEVGGYVSAGGGVSGDVGVTFKHTDDGEVYDPVPESMRTKHQQFIEWLNSK